MNNNPLLSLPSPLFSKPPRVVRGEYCSTARSSLGSCPHLDRSLSRCNLFDDSLEKTSLGYIRCFSCLQPV